VRMAGSRNRVPLVLGRRHATLVRTEKSRTAGRCPGFDRPPISSEAGL